MASYEPLMQPGADGLDLLASLLRRPSWHGDALCKEFPEVSFFPDRGEDTSQAKSVCRRCCVRAECEAFAMSDPEAFSHGIWGGTSGRERKVARRGRAA